MPTIPVSAAGLRRARQQAGSGVTTRRAEATFEELEAGLRIDENRMEEECRNQPTMLYQVSKRLSLAISKHDQAKLHVKEVEAEVYIELRAEAERRDEKVTEKMLEMLCTDSAGVRAAKRQELEAGYEASRFWALKESFSSRDKALEHLIKLFIANYYGSDMDRSDRTLRSATAVMAQRDIRQQRRLRE